MTQYLYYNYYMIDSNIINHNLNYKFSFNWIAPENVGCASYSLVT